MAFITYEITRRVDSLEPVLRELFLERLGAVQSACDTALDAWGATIGAMPRPEGWTDEGYRHYVIEALYKYHGLKAPAFEELVGSATVSAQSPTDAIENLRTEIYDLEKAGRLIEAKAKRAELEGIKR